jgi:hypothetical protein
MREEQELWDLWSLLQYYGIRTSPSIVHGADSDGVCLLLTHLGIHENRDSVKNNQCSVTG